MTRLFQNQIPIVLLFESLIIFHVQELSLKDPIYWTEKGITWESIIGLHKLEKRVKIEVMIKFRMFLDYVGTTPNSVTGRLHASYKIVECGTYIKITL